MWECEWWNLFKTTTCVKEDLRESFPYKRPLREESLLEQIRSSKLFGYVQCDIELPEELKKKLANFPPIFKNTKVGPHDEVELAKAKIEHRKPILVGIFILQYAKLRILELYYKVFERFSDVNKF